MPHHQTIFNARKNGSGSRQYVDGKAVNVDGILNLLVNGSQPTRHPAIRRASSSLIEKMAEASWRISAGPHKGGREGDRGADSTNHITVSFGPGRSYHLRLDRKGHLFQITGPGIPSETQPWQAPGSHPPRES